jgi:hypothetical protein
MRCGICFDATQVVKRVFRNGLMLMPSLPGRGCGDSIPRQSVQVNPPIFCIFESPTFTQQTRPPTPTSGGRLTLTGKVSCSLPVIATTRAVFSGFLSGIPLIDRQDREDAV